MNLGSGALQEKQIFLVDCIEFCVAPFCSFPPSPSLLPTEGILTTLVKLRGTDADDDNVVESINNGHLTKEPPSVQGSILFGKETWEDLPEKNNTALRNLSSQAYS